MANLVSCDYNDSKIYKHSGISSTILTSFASPDSYPAGLTFDSLDAIWLAANNAPLNLSASVVAI